MVTLFCQKENDSFSFPILFMKVLHSSRSTLPASLLLKGLLNPLLPFFGCTTSGKQTIFEHTILIIILDPGHKPKHRWACLDH